jgi:hypothetical protein
VHHTLPLVSTQKHCTRRRWQLPELAAHELILKGQAMQLCAHLTIQHLATSSLHPHIAHRAEQHACALISRSSAMQTSSSVRAQLFMSSVSHSHITHARSRPPTTTVTQRKAVMEGTPPAQRKEAAPHEGQLELKPGDAELCETETLASLPQDMKHLLEEKQGTSSHPPPPPHPTAGTHPLPRHLHTVLYTGAPDIELDSAQYLWGNSRHHCWKFIHCMQRPAKYGFPLATQNRSKSVSIG